MQTHNAYPINESLREADQHLIAQQMGNAALAEREQVAMRSIELSGRVYETDLPAGYDVLLSNPDPDNPNPDPNKAVLTKSDLLQESLIVEKLDDLPLGTYHISGNVKVLDFGGVTDERVTRTIAVDTGPKGNVISPGSFGDSEQGWKLQANTEKMMADLGYLVGDDVNGEMNILGVPTRRTISEAVKAHGFEIKFFEGQRYISGADYLDAHIEGAHPVSSQHYEHDVEDDHVTARVLGKDPLTKALIQAAEHGKALGGEAIDTTASGIDTYTASLRAITSPHDQFNGSQYGKENGRKFLIKVGESIGISATQTNEIIATAQESARHYGMDVKELD